MEQSAIFGQGSIVTTPIYVPTQGTPISTRHWSTMATSGASVSPSLSKLDYRRRYTNPVID